jgi:hypothetical protein
MDQIALWLDPHHISVGTILATVTVVVGASVAMLLLNRPLQTIRSILVTILSTSKPLLPCIEG